MMAMCDLKFCGSVNSEEDTCDVKKKGEKMLI